MIGIGFPEQLRDDLDLLASRQQIVEWNASHASHLSVVDEAHELVHEPLR